MIERKILFPEKWSDDLLTQFIDLSQLNSKATFDHPKYKTICEVMVLTDLCYQMLIDSLKDTEHLIPALLCLRAHSAYRTACHLALSGQGPETFVISRSCIEYALYAHHIHKDAELSELWLNRHDNDVLLKKHRREFTSGRALEGLSKICPALSDAASRLYETCIDFGGHPNPRSVTSTARLEETPGTDNIKIIYLANPDMEIFSFAMQSVVQVGYVSFEILRLIWGGVIPNSKEMETLVAIHNEWGTMSG